MSVHKIGSKTSVYGDGANYSFQYNPKTTNSVISSKKSLIDIPFRSISPYHNFSSVTPKSINLLGNFMGVNKKTYLHQLSYWLMSKGLKKYYYDTNEFVFFLGGTVKKLKEGKGYNFINYVANLNCPLPFVYGAAKTYVVTDVSGTALTLNDSTANSTGLFSNIGYGPAHIQRITVEVVTGTLTKVEFGDKVLSGSDVAGDNIITWEGSIAAGKTLNLYLIYEIDNKGTKWYCFEVADDSTDEGVRDLNGDNVEDGPRIDGLQTDQDFSLKLTGVTNADVTCYWYDTNYL